MAVVVACSSGCAQEVQMPRSGHFLIASRLVLAILTFSLKYEMQLAFIFSHSALMRSRFSSLAFDWRNLFGLKFKFTIQFSFCISSVLVQCKKKPCFYVIASRFGERLNMKHLTAAENSLMNFANNFQLCYRSNSRMHEICAIYWQKPHPKSLLLDNKINRLTPSCNRKRELFANM